jgi:hypothetical protein
MVQTFARLFSLLLLFSVSAASYAAEGLRFEGDGAPSIFAVLAQDSALIELDHLYPKAVTLILETTKEESADLFVPEQVIRISELASQEIQNLRSAHTVAFVDGASPRDRLNNYCYEECACLNKNFTKILSGRNIPFRTLLLKPGHAVDIGLRIGSAASFSARYTFSHFATLIEIQGEWWVLDPIGIGSTQLERLETWMTRVENPSALSAQIY